MASSSWSTSLYRRRHEPARARTACGTRRTASSTTCCAPRRHRHAAQGPLDGRAAAAVRHHGHREVAAGANSASDGAVSERLRRMPELLKSIHPTGPGHLGVADGGSWPWSTRSGCAGSSPDARRERVPEPLRHPLALEVPPGASLRLQRAAARSTAWTTCRRNRTPACSAAIPTGAARSGCR